MPFALNKLNAVLILLALSSTPYFLQAKDSETKEDLKAEIKEYISHHLEDAHDYNLFSFTNDIGEHVYIGIPLPIILWDKGLHVFSSSKLNHGASVAHVDENHYKLDHGKIYKTGEGGDDKVPFTASITDAHVKRQHKQSGQWHVIEKHDIDDKV